MSDIPVRIWRGVLTGHYGCSEKARLEMECDGITELDVAESILKPPRLTGSCFQESTAPAARMPRFDSGRQPGWVGDILER